MKRFITYCLIAVTLFIGVTSARMLRSDNNSRTNNFNGIYYGHQKSSSGENHTYFLATDFVLSASGSEHLRLPFFSQNGSFRIIPFSNTFRITHSSQIVHLQYNTITSCFVLLSAIKQSGGYYLYHLRKLLI